jgi:hypothetical protein
MSGVERLHDVPAFLVPGVSADYLDLCHEDIVPSSGPGISTGNRSVTGDGTGGMLKFSDANPRLVI